MSGEITYGSYINSLSSHYALRSPSEYAMSKERGLWVCVALSITVNLYVVVVIHEVVSSMLVQCDDEAYERESRDMG